MAKCIFSCLRSNETYEIAEFINPFNLFNSFHSSFAEKTKTAFSQPTFINAIDAMEDKEKEEPKREALDVRIARTLAKEKAEAEKAESEKTSGKCGFALSSVYM